MKPMDAEITEPIHKLEKWNRDEAYRLTVSIFKDEGDHDFTAIALNLPGATGCGETQDEAVVSLKESVFGLIKTYASHGEEIPWEPVDNDPSANRVGHAMKVIDWNV